MNDKDYIKVNQALWNNKTALHLGSAFYDMPAFMAGKNMLKTIELELLGDIKGKSILHLQCHFGQDSISLARMGAKVTAVDFSSVAISKANELSSQLNADVQFIESDVLDLIGKIDQKFDIVFATYGTIGWLPDINKWAKTVAHHLKPSGKLVFVESHPVMWTLDNDFDKIQYRYFQFEAIIETEESSYTDSSKHAEMTSISWNHSISEVVNALIKEGIRIERLDEYDYFPYPVFGDQNSEEQLGQFRPKSHGNKLPYTYSILGSISS